MCMHRRALPVPTRTRMHGHNARPSCLPLSPHPCHCPHPPPHAPYGTALQVSGRAQESLDQAKQSSQEAWDSTKSAAQETADKVGVVWPHTHSTP